MGFFKAGLPAILRKTEAEKPAETGGALARHFSPPVERRPPAPRSKLVLACDATASREHAWQTATVLTDAILATMPNQLDVALAVHGGETVTLFTRFTSDANKLRDRASGIRCLAGETRMLPILARVLKIKGVSTIVYIGDVFEESERQARKYADALKANGTRLIILHDYWPGTFSNEKGIFAEMAARS